MQWSRPFAAVLASGAVALACDRLLEPGFEEWTPPPRAAEAAPPPPREACAARDPLRQAYFGDLHVHTGYSMDARAWGTTATPADAYRFARGEEVELPFALDEAGGPRRVRIDRPLDFAAVTDHAEWMAEVSLCTTRGSSVYESGACRIYRGEEESRLARWLSLSGFYANLLGVTGFFGRNTEICGDDAGRCRQALADVWQRTREAAERFQDRTSDCRFTTFQAWEYSETPAMTKVHRNVILRGTAAPELPFSWVDTPSAPELWRKLRDLCLDAGAGCDAISIPHNPNLSNGRMFAVWYRDLPEDEQRDEARLRARLEPVVEMMQVKGESECRNGFADVAGGPDELCDFEKIRDLPGQPLADCGNGTGSGAQAGRGCISRLDYVRYALVEGLREQARIGVDPYAFGFIGSSDGHLALPGAVGEQDFPGSRAGLPAPRDRLALDPEAPYRSEIWRNPGGLVGVWAEENSREAIFDALERRETFATSGPRIQPRFFGGFDLPSDLCRRPGFVEEGYARGVPMGGELPARPAGVDTPLFVAAALRDPGSEGREGGFLQRIQIVKAWAGADGEVHQLVVDVAGDADNGAFVHLPTCEPRGPGAATLCGAWRDPDFDPERAAVYYARVIENPSCRWSAWQCLELEPDERPATCSDPRIPKVVQERAWTSPIWYVPPPTAAPGSAGDAR